MNKRAIALISIALLLLLNGYLLVRIFSRTRVDPVTVTITAKGFEPKELAVALGANVIFVNQTKEPHWPASNFHPTHELYPEFDIKRPLLPRESWQFVFTKEGSWGYHDHLNPQITGKIIVGKSLIPGAENNFSAVKSSKSEATEKVKEIAKSQGSIAAWRYFKTTYNNNNLDGSHDIAHYIGLLMYKQVGVDGLRQCDSSFAFGCFHGLVEEFIAEEGTMNLKAIVEKCLIFSEFQGQLTCYHGMGHGILPYYQYDLSKALRECDNVLPSKYQFYCYNGVFMENALVYSKKATPKNPLWPCNIIEKKYKRSCYGYQMVFLKNLYNDNVNKIAQACSMSEKEEYMQACIKGLGHQIAQENIRTPDQILLLCGQIEGRIKYDCQLAAAEEFVFQRGAYDTARSKLCSHLPRDYSRQCLERIEIQKRIQL